MVAFRMSPEEAQELNVKVALWSFKGYYKNIKAKESGLERSCRKMKCILKDTSRIAVLDENMTTLILMRCSCH